MEQIKRNKRGDLITFIILLTFMGMFLAGFAWENDNLRDKIIDLEEKNEQLITNIAMKKLFFPVKN